jgi:hypothetical protein
MIGAASELAKLQGEKPPEDQTAEHAAKVQASLFNVMAIDIESTVGRAAMLCLHDSSVTKEVRKERARGLLKLGRIFQGRLEPAKK